MWKNTFLIGKERYTPKCQAGLSVCDGIMVILPWWVHGFTWDYLRCLIFSKFSTMNIYFSRLFYLDCLIFWTHINHQVVLTWSAWSPWVGVKSICERHETLCTMLHITRVFLCIFLLEEDPYLFKNYFY